MVRPVSGGRSRYKGGSMGQRQRVQGLAYLRWPRFRGPGFLFCFECRDPMGQGVPPGNKILVWVKEGNPREKEKRS